MVGARHGEESAGAHAALISSASWLTRALSTACGAAERVPPRREAGKHASGRQAGAAAAALRLWVRPRQRLPTGVPVVGMSTQDCRLGWPGGRIGCRCPRARWAGFVPHLARSMAPKDPLLGRSVAATWESLLPCPPPLRLNACQYLLHLHSNLTFSQYQHLFSNPVPNFCAATQSRQ